MGIIYYVSCHEVGGLIYFDLGAFVAGQEIYEMA